jgi:hypothetical protein
MVPRHRDSECFIQKSLNVSPIRTRNTEIDAFIQSNDVIAADSRVCLNNVIQIDNRRAMNSNKTTGIEFRLDRVHSFAD